MIKRILLTIFINALALFLVQIFLGEDMFSILPSWGIIPVAIVMGLLNFVIKPLLSLIAFPLLFLTFGLFLSAINVFLLWLNQYLFDEILTIGIKFEILGGWSTYILAAILLSFMNSLFHFFIRVK